MPDVKVRTTITLEPKVAEKLREEVSLGKLSFKEVVNAALRRGLGFEEPAQRVPYRIKPHSSPFLPGVDSGKLNQLVDELEAEEFRR